MAQPSPKSAARGARREPASHGKSRLEVAGKLFALLVLPLSILFSIFAGGVLLGATRADRVVELEQKWLRVDPPKGRLLGGAAPVEDAGDDEAGEAGGEAEAKPDEPKPDEPKPDEPKPVEPKPVEPKPVEPKPVETQTQPGLPVAVAAPVGDELRRLFEEPRVVDVQIMVDPALVVAREDWLSYIASLFDATRASYAALFNIKLQLHGVVVWDAAAGADANELLADLAARERDGADILLGLVARERPNDFTAPSWPADVIGDHALVFADLQQSDRYYRSLLRTLAELFGAEPAVDPASKQLGSFMSDAVPAPGAAPVIDPGNRGLVIFNKRSRFAAPAPESDPNPDEPNPDEPQPALEAEDN